jgi:hypothetical protein
MEGMRGDEPPYSTYRANPPSFQLGIRLEYVGRYPNLDRWSTDRSGCGWCKPALEERAS